MSNPQDNLVDGDQHISYARTEATPLHYRDVSKETPCTGCEECVSVCDAGKHTRHAVSGHGCVSMAEPLPAMLDELVENASLDQLQDAHATLAEPDSPQDAPQQTWVPVYVEQAICDLIPDVGFARECARGNWNLDETHGQCLDALFHWQNEAIRQRRDLIALREGLAVQLGPG